MTMTQLFTNLAFDQLISTIPAEMERLHIPGLALGVVHGEQVFTAGFGVTNLDNPLHVTPQTLFQVGSITKTFTALAAMCLVEQGKLDLDAPLRVYVPDLRLADEEVARRVTARHLFAHTGGWLGDYFADTGPGDDALAKAGQKLADLPQETPLGEIYSYNNAGFYLAGRLVEILSGMSYETAIHKMILQPLGMDTSFFFAHDAITYRVAVGHDAVYPNEDRAPAVLRPWWLTRAANPVGALVAPVDDLLRYARFQWSGGLNEHGERLLSAENLAEMQTPRTLAANGEQVGVSWFIRQVGEVQIIRHGGATNGQMATLQIAPAQRFALVVLTNSDRGSELYTPLVGRALSLFLGVEDKAPEPLVLPASALIDYAGLYCSAMGDLRLEVIEQGGKAHLLASSQPKGGFPTPDSPPPPAPPPVRVALTGPDSVIVLDEPGKGDRGEFLREPDGEIAWLRMGGRVHRKVA
jgi:CubicO group peptidase (beta-lactamase class C family)